MKKSAEFSGRGRAGHPKCRPAGAAVRGCGVTYFSVRLVADPARRPDGRDAELYHSLLARLPARRMLRCVHCIPRQNAQLPMCRLQHKATHGNASPDECSSGKTSIWLPRASRKPKCKLGVHDCGPGGSVCATHTRAARVGITSGEPTPWLDAMAYRPLPSSARIASLSSSSGASSFLSTRSNCQRPGSD